MKFFTEVVVPEGSPLIGQQVMDVGIFKRDGMRVIDVLRGEESLRRQFPEVALAEGDRVVLRTEMQELLGLKDSNQVTLVDRVGSKSHDDGRGADHARLQAGRPLARQPAAAPALRRLPAGGAPAEPEHRPPARRRGGAGRRHAAARGRARRHPPAGRRRRPRRPQRDRPTGRSSAGARRSCWWCSAAIVLASSFELAPIQILAMLGVVALLVTAHHRAGGGLQHGQRLADRADPRDAGRRRRRSSTRARRR